MNEDGSVSDVAAGQGVGGTEPRLRHTDDPWVRFMQAKGCNRAHSAILPGRGLMIRQGAGWYWWLNLVHPCRVKSFRKAVSTVMDDLGMDDKIIENLNNKIV